MNCPYSLAGSHKDFTPPRDYVGKGKPCHSRESGIQVLEIVAVSACLDARLRGHDE